MKTRSSSRLSALIADPTPVVRLSPLELAISRIRMELLLSSLHPVTLHTAKELTSIPARCFPKFKKLPNELQAMVWEFAMNETIIELAVHPDIRKFQASTSKVAILAYSWFDLAQFALCPLYLQTTQYWGPRPPQPSLEPIFVCPQDILYMPEIYKLDINSFLARDENHCIENLATSATSALRLGWRTAQEGGQMIRGLTQLRKLYIFEGRYVNDEMGFSGTGAYHFSMLEVKDGAKSDDTVLQARANRYSTKEWDSTVADSIRRGFQLEMRSARADFKVPELLFRELRRHDVGTGEALYNHDS